MVESGFDADKTEYIINGFNHGFGIGYEGPEDRRDTAENLPLNNLGTKTDLWNKVMKEVKMGRYAGPFKYQNIPFKNFVKSPIGLVPKAGNKTRLIFHLSYDFKNGNTSINSNGPHDRCTVKYKDLDHAVDIWIKLLNKHGKNRILHFSKTDLESAFRVAPVLVAHRKWLLMCAVNPVTGEKLYFINKCLPFGSRISCAVFQAISDALAHITEFLLKLEDPLINYLDDFLFIKISEDYCNHMMSTFLLVCSKINCPVSQDKTVWSSVIIVFLGTLLDGERHCLCIPEEKRTKALNKLHLIGSKRKAMAKEVQSLTGTLNFLNHAIVPGRVFTRRMYSKVKTTTATGRKLKPYHHVNIDTEFKKDMQIWKIFLENAELSVLCRKFVDKNRFVGSEHLSFYTDASGKIGFGCFFDGRWAFGEWNKSFLVEAEPSIEFLELFALCAGILMWGNIIRDVNVVIYCDNQAVIDMVNSTTSSCRNCMYLLRLTVLNGLQANRRLTVKYIKSSDNILADSLSRLKWNTFWNNAPPNTCMKPTEIPKEIWPIENFWIW